MIEAGEALPYEMAWDEGEMQIGTLLCKKVRVAAKGEKRRPPLPPGEVKDLMCHLLEEEAVGAQEAIEAAYWEMTGHCTKKGGLDSEGGPVDRAGYVDDIDACPTFFF